MTDQEIKEQVQEVLDKLRPFLLRDGGDCELIDVEDGVPKLHDHIKSRNRARSFRRSTRHRRSRASILIQQITAVSLRRPLLFF